MAGTYVTHVVQGCQFGSGVFYYLLPRTFGEAVPLMKCDPKVVTCLHPEEVSGAAFVIANSPRSFGGMFWVCPPCVLTRHFCSFVRFARLVTYKDGQAQTTMYTTCRTCSRYRQVSLWASFHLACYFDQTLGIGDVWEPHYDLKPSDLAHYYLMPRRLERKARKATLATLEAGRKWRQLTQRSARRQAQLSSLANPHHASQDVFVDACVDACDTFVDACDAFVDACDVCYYYDTQLVICDANQTDDSIQASSQASQALPESANSTEALTPDKPNSTNNSTKVFTPAEPNPTNNNEPANSTNKSTKDFTPAEPNSTNNSTNNSTKDFTPSEPDSTNNSTNNEPANSTNNSDESNGLKPRLHVNDTNAWMHALLKKKVSQVQEGSLNAQQPKHQTGVTKLQGKPLLPEKPRLDQNKTNKTQNKVHTTHVGVTRNEQVCVERKQTKPTLKKQKQPSKSKADTTQEQQREPSKSKDDTKQEQQREPGKSKADTKQEKQKEPSKSKADTKQKDSKESSKSKADTKQEESSKSKANAKQEEPSKSKVDTKQEEPKEPSKSEADAKQEEPSKFNAATKQEEQEEPSKFKADTKQEEQKEPIKSKADTEQEKQKEPSSSTDDTKQEMQEEPLESTAQGRDATFEIKTGNANTPKKLAKKKVAKKKKKTKSGKSKQKHTKKTSEVVLDDDNERLIEAALGLNGIEEVDYLDYPLDIKKLDAGHDLTSEPPSLARLLKNDDEPLSWREFVKKADAFSDSSVPFGCKFCYRWDHIQRVVLFSTKVCAVYHLDETDDDSVMRGLAMKLAHPPSAAQQIDAATLSGIVAFITGFKLLTSTRKLSYFWQFYEVYTPLGNLTLSLPMNNFKILSGHDFDHRLAKQLALRIVDSVVAFDDLCTTCDNTSILPAIVKASKSAPDLLDCTAARFGMRNRWWGTSLTLAILGAQQRVANLLAWSFPYTLGPTVLTSMLLASRGKLFGRQALEAYSKVIRLEVNAGLCVYTDSTLRLEVEGKTLAGLCSKSVEYVLAGKVKQSLFARTGVSSRSADLGAIRDRAFQALVDDTPSYLDFCRPCGRHDLGDYSLISSSTNPSDLDNQSSFSTSSPSDQEDFTFTSTTTSTTTTSTTFATPSDQAPSEHITRAVCSPSKLKNNFMWQGAMSDAVAGDFHAFADIYDAFVSIKDAKPSSPIVVKTSPDSTIAARYQYLLWLKRTANAGYYDLLVGMVGFVVELLFTGVHYPKVSMCEADTAPFWQAVLGVVAGCAVKHTLSYESIVVSNDHQEGKDDSNQTALTSRQRHKQEVMRHKQAPTKTTITKVTREFIAGVTFATVVRSCIFAQKTM